jgi:hypothetical protein
MNGTFKIQFFKNGLLKFKLVSKFNRLDTEVHPFIITGRMLNRSMFVHSGLVFIIWIRVFWFFNFMNLKSANLENVLLEFMLTKVKVKVVASDDFLPIHSVGDVQDSTFQFSVEKEKKNRKNNN